MEDKTTMEDLMSVISVISGQKEEIQAASDCYEVSWCRRNLLLIIEWIIIIIIGWTTVSVTIEV